MKLSDILSQDAIIPGLTSFTKEGVIEEITDVIVRAHPGQDKNLITSALLDREKLGSTGIEDGIAIPHAKIRGLDRIIIAVGTSKKGIDFQAHDGKPSKIFFVLLAPDNSAGVHLKTLARLSRLLREEDVRLTLLESKSKEDIYNTIITEDENLSC